MKQYNVVAFRIETIYDAESLRDNLLQLVRMAASVRKFCCLANPMQASKLRQ